MARVLFVEPEEYSELEISLQEEGIEYDRATAEEAKELFARVDYDGVVGPERANLYEAAVKEGIPYLAFDTYGRNFTDTLSGVPDVDAERIDRYLGQDDDIGTEFLLSVLRHDIGNDLNVAMGYTELLEENDSKEEHEKYWDVLKGKMRSIEGLLESTRAVEHLSGEEFMHVNVNGSIKKTLDEYEAAADDRGIDISFSADDEYIVDAGPLLDDLYGQLIENGINHSGGSLIDINISGNDRFTRVDIEDDGDGIPEDVRDQILQKGFTNGDTGNTGIGLYLVSEIADVYDIHLDVGDSEKHGGARFTTVIPRSDRE